MKTRLLILAVLASIIFIVRAAVPADKGAPAGKVLAAHEWGTFTSVQGADGVQMNWNPYVAPDLPAFVYDRVRVRAGKLNPGMFMKSNMISRQRMETPVIYFYTDRARTVDVAVNFPEGSITEWYPQDTVADANRLPTAKSGKPVLLWKGVEVLPPADSAKITLPVDPSGSHYFAARETDAAILRVPVGENKTEVEKFLFYRGVAGFQAPLTVKPDVNDSRRLTLTNTGAEELRHLFVYEVRDDGGAWLSLDKLAPGETRSVSLDRAPGVRALTSYDLSLDQALRGGEDPETRLNGALYRALINEGLYARESSAMVKTWESSWFGEKGLRVLYVLPRAWTDRTLPLTIDPKPQAIERVMVARAEVITPETERQLLGLVERYLPAGVDTREKIVAETRALGLGRFLPAAMSRVTANPSRSPEFRDSANQLVFSASMSVSGPAKVTAAK